MNTPITIEFESITLKAELFNSPIAARISKTLPVSIRLEQWGNELYGPIGLDLGEHSPVTAIPPGGIAYTNKGNYLCIFYGQDPAWPVEYIGQIMENSWKRLITEEVLDSVTIRGDKSNI